ncbi:hypothetical protein [Stenotrophomonas sp. YIM B06876]|uniref:hypothetical protein n=1 Tax=Stenotrophomonas sp. YIM B06876 TaxID=3060211 RepID=UPI0027382387|nr:hypothetical protein [Stenotrophomonas sp. YIM B06876]
MKLRKWKLATLLLCAAMAAPPVLAAKRANTPPPDPTQDPLMITAGFLSGHPDLRFRLLALEKREAGKQEDAFKFFQRAAFYADKPSQAMVAEMLWTGLGTGQDKALAYAWMDLAAERGYEGFVQLREHYWLGLDETKRARAISLGEEIYARYGDEAAQPRIATALRRERRSVTGSRTGFVGNLRIFVPGPAGPEEIDGSKFYDERYWDPAKYQAWHDSIWMKPRVATVKVGDVKQQVDPEMETRIPKVAPALDAQEPQTDEAMPTLESRSNRP